jgi:hypothetical protein
MALGVILSLVVGIGLMALVVLSSRARYDEPAVLIEEPDLDQEEAQIELERVQISREEEQQIPNTCVISRRNEEACFSPADGVR